MPAGAEPVAAPLVSADAAKVEMLTDFQPLDAVGDLAAVALKLAARFAGLAPVRESVEK